MQEEKQLTYTTTNTYHTLNAHTSATKTIWMVFHGIGYLSRYFIAHFKDLDPVANYVVAPQAPSKYYLNGEYKHVGASWLTREKKDMEIGNILNYVNAVYKAEAANTSSKLLVLGFSQGVSVALRWVARHKINCSQLVLYAGGIPDELKAGDFDFLGPETMIRFIIGDSDKYLTPERMEKEQEKLDRIFRGAARVTFFKGGHEIQPEVLNKLVS